jgi:DNA polymerase-3 subunit epsilon
MRQIVLDTETTGLSTAQGHRIIEIGCVELVNRRLTGREFHRFLNPDREIDFGAERVHGLSRADLEHQPRFRDVVEELLAFLADAELVMHNAEFDVGFLEHELALMQHPKPRLSLHCRILDTLALAREMHPGQRNTLDALCKRYEVDASKRDVHGALIDAELLARVYLAMTGGQTALVLDADAEARPLHGFTVPDLAAFASVAPAGRIAVMTLDLPVIVASAEEEARHEEILARLRAGGQCVWDRLAPGGALQNRTGTV